MCHATQGAMAFKQVKSRASLFRPWAFGGDSQPLNRNDTHSSEIQLEPEKQSDAKLVSTPPQSSINDAEKSFLVPSAFRSTALLGRTIQPLALIDTPSYSIGAPPMLNMVQDLHHHTQEMSTCDEIVIPPEGVKVNHPCWNIAQEIPFPVTHQFNQLLEQPNISKYRVKKQRPKRFRCPHCQVSFSNNGQLKGHLRIHSGERPFACDHPSCGKQFTRNEELTRHKRIHTGVRPHSCILCGKRFGRKDHLKKHIKTHNRTNVVRMPISAFQGLSYFVSDCIPWF